MAKKPKKMCSTCLIIRECKSKLQWGIISHRSEWQSLKKSTNNKCWRGYGKKGTLLHCWWKCRVKNGLEVPQKAKNRATIWSINPTPGHTSGGNHNLKDKCNPMFTATLFTMPRAWKQPKCPLTDKWIKKMWCVYTTEYYSAIKKNKIMTRAATWMDLEIFILREASQTEKDKYHTILLICRN